MERYCGALQPAIRSRRIPYSSLNRYVVDHARLSQIKLIYGSSIRAQLALRPEHVQKGRQVPGCTYHPSLPQHTHLLTAQPASDPTCILLPARQTTVLDRGTRDKITAALCTRFDTVAPAVLRAPLPIEIEEWGKLRIVNDGDTMRAALMERATEDQRDCSFVRVH